MGKNRLSVAVQMHGREKVSSLSLFDHMHQGCWLVWFIFIYGLQVMQILCKVFQYFLVYMPAKVVSKPDRVQVFVLRFHHRVRVQLNNVNGEHGLPWRGCDFVALQRPNCFRAVKTLIYDSHFPIVKKRLWAVKRACSFISTACPRCVCHCVDVEPAVIAITNALNGPANKTIME